jgi:hypothetical protein
MSSIGLEAGPRDEQDDNMGAGAARAAAEALAAAGRDVQAALRAGDNALLVGALIRLNEATVAVELLYDRQLSAAVIRQAHRATDYAEGYEDGLAARRGLRSVG